MPLPSEYHLEVYEGSFINDPSCSLESSTPLPALSVGDRFDHRMIGNWYHKPDSKKEFFRIKEINHLFWEIEDSHIGYKMMVCVEIAAKVE